MKLAGKKAIPLQVMTYAWETNLKNTGDNLAVMLEDRRKERKMRRCRCSEWAELNQCGRRKRKT